MQHAKRLRKGKGPVAAACARGRWVPQVTTLGQSTHLKPNRPASKRLVRQSCASFQVSLDLHNMVFEGALNLPVVVRIFLVDKVNVLVFSVGAAPAKVLVVA